MKKQLIGFLVCMMMLATIPLAAGVNEETCEEETSVIKTFVRGIILRPRFTARSISFGTVFAHYRVIGKGVSGTVRFPQRLSFDTDYKGILTGHIVFAVFDGEPDL